MQTVRTSTACRRATRFVWSTLSAVKLHGERGASNGSSRSSRESAGRRWSTRYERGKDNMKGIYRARQREREVASQKRRKNEARRERGTILRSEEGARDSIRRASLILESETTGRETEPLIFRHHFSFASVLLLPRDVREVNGTPARFVDMQGKFLKRRG